MDKKNKKYRKEAFYRYAFAVSLAGYLKKECDNRNNKTKESSDGSCNGTIELDALVSVLGSKPAVIHERLTLKRYLVTVIRLFKIAFVHKQTDSAVKTFWGIME